MQAASISAFLTVVLDGIHQGLRMFNANAHRNGLLPAHPSNRTTQKHRGRCAPWRGSGVSRGAGGALVATSSQATASNTPSTASTSTNRAPKCTWPPADKWPRACADDLRQFVRPNVRMGIHQNRWVRTEVNQPLQSTADVASLVASRIQFTIAVGACSAFSKTVIRIGIYGVVAGDFHKVPPALAHGLAAFQNDGTSALADERKCRKQPCRSGTYDVDRFRVGWEGIQLRAGTNLQQATTRWRHLKSPDRLNGSFARVEVFAHHAVFTGLTPCSPRIWPAPAGCAPRRNSTGLGTERPQTAQAHRSDSVYAGRWCRSAMARR